MEEKKLKIIVDSRESIPYLFKDYEDVVIIRDNLDVGDFSLVGHTDELMLERKTLSDLCGSFTARREEFQDMWKRTIQRVRFLMIEGKVADAFWGNFQANFHPHSLIATLMSWEIKYHYNWFFVDNNVEGQMAIYYIFKEFLKLKNKGVL